MGSRSAGCTPPHSPRLPSCPFLSRPRAHGSVAAQSLRGLSIARPEAAEQWAQGDAGLRVGHTGVSHEDAGPALPDALGRCGLFSGGGIGLPGNPAGCWGGPRGPRMTGWRSSQTAEGWPGLRVQGGWALPSAPSAASRQLCAHEREVMSFLSSWGSIHRGEKEQTTASPTPSRGL